MVIPRNTSAPTEWLGAFRNPSLTFGALIGAANVRERSSSDARFLTVIALVGKSFPFGWPSWTGPSTNSRCQQENPENSQVKTWGSASTRGLSAHPRMTSLPTGENARRGKTIGMLGIRARETRGAAVNKTAARSWGRKVVAPQKPWFPTTSPLRHNYVSH